MKGLCVEPIDSKKIVQINLLKVTKRVSIFVCGACVRCSAVWEKVIFQLGYLVLVGASCAAARVLLVGPTSL